MKFWIQTSSCNEDNPGGAIAEAVYEIVGDDMIVTGQDERPIGREKLAGDPLTQAKRMLRKGRPRNDFNRPLKAPRLGIY